MSSRHLKKHRSDTLCTPICMPKSEASSTRPCLESLDIPDHLIQQPTSPNFCTAKPQPLKSSHGSCSTCSCHKHDYSTTNTCSRDKNNLEMHKERKCKKEHRHCCKKSNAKIKKDDSRCRVKIQPPCCTADSSSNPKQLESGSESPATMSLNSCVSFATSIDYQPSKSNYSQTGECCEVDLQSGPHIIKIQLMPPPPTSQHATSSTQLRNSCTPSMSKESQTHMKKASNLSWNRNDQIYSPSDSKPISVAQMTDTMPTCSKHHQTEPIGSSGCCTDMKGESKEAEENGRQHVTLHSEPVGSCTRLKIEMNQVHCVNTPKSPNAASKPRQCCHKRDAPQEVRKTSGCAMPTMSCEFTAPKDCECSLPPAYNEYGCTGNISGNCNCTGD